MINLVEFLNARLDEDAQAAQAAHYEGQRWISEEEDVNRWPDDEDVYSADRKCDAAHIARHDPARVLAEVEAKRAILALHGTNTQEPYAAKVPGGMFYPPDPFYCDCQSEDGLIYGKEPCDTKRLLALPFAAHPDYDPSWAIE